jgi:PAS domain S-box-containing protein
MDRLAMQGCWFMHEAKRLLRRHGLSLAATTLAFLFTLLFWPISQRFPFALFIAAVLVSAWRGGLKPGLVTTGLSMLALIAVYFLLPAERASEAGEHYILRLGMFALVGVLAGFLSRRCKQAILAVDRVHDTLSHLGQALIFTDAFGRVSYLSPLAQTLTGWNPIDAHEKSLGQVLALINSETRQPLADPVTGAIQGRMSTPLPEGTLLLTAAGTETPIEGRAAPLLDADARLVGAAVSFHEVPRDRRAEKEMRQNDERFRAAAACSPVPLLMLDARGACLFANRAFHNLAGLVFAEGLGEGWLHCIHPDDRDRFLADWTASVQTQETREYTGELRLHVGGITNPSHEHQGTARWARLRSAPMLADRSTLGHVVTVEEISERKLVEERLHASDQRAAAAARERQHALEALQEAREELAELRQDQTAIQARQHAEEALNQARAELDNLRRHHATAQAQSEDARAKERKEIEQTLQRVRAELAGHIDRHAAEKRSADETLRKVRQDYEKQLEDLMADLMKDKTALEEKLAESQLAGESLTHQHTRLREQVTAHQQTIANLTASLAACAVVLYKASNREKPNYTYREEEGEMPVGTLAQPSEWLSYN